MKDDIDNIIFDFGGVLIGIDYNATIDAFRSLGIPNFDVLYSQAIQTNLFDDFETGKVSAQHFINKLLDLIPGSISPNAVVSAWNAMLLDIHAENVRFLEQFKQSGRKLYMLSNTNELHIKIAFDRWKKCDLIAPEELFHRIFLSHEIGIRKPDQEVFEFVCSGARLDPEKTLFIDDSVQHIEGANAFGLKTLHLTEIDALQSCLS